MEYKDYYKILGVDKTATEEVIKKRYRVLARKYHPDVSKEANAEEKFKEVKEAYEVLKDPAKRQAYDQLGTQSGPEFRTPPGWQYQQYSDSSEPEFAAGGFSEFFENLFGQRASGRARPREYNQAGEDLHSKISIGLEEAFSGTERLIQLQEPRLDERGEVKLHTRSLKVKIPAGVTAGQQIRLSGQGSPGLGKGRQGDLYLEIQLLDHPFYKLRNKDIYLDLPVTPWEAALGATIEVPTLGSKIELKIPAGSQTGKKLRLKGRGLPGKTPGDQYITLMIYIPTPETDHQRELYRSMAEAMPYNPRQELLRT